VEGWAKHFCSFSDGFRIDTDFGIALQPNSSSVSTSPPSLSSPTASPPRYIPAKPPLSTSPPAVALAATLAAFRAPHSPMRGCSSERWRLRGRPRSALPRERDETSTERASGGRRPRRSRPRMPQTIPVCRQTDAGRCCSAELPRSFPADDARACLDFCYPSITPTQHKILVHRVL
jgi:hypothetical protein